MYYGQSICNNNLKLYKNESGDIIFGVSIIRQDKKHYLKNKVGTNIQS